MYKKVKKLNPSEAAYIAGLIDGEGTITLTRKHVYEYRQLAITITNGDYKLLKYILNIVGAGKITKKRPYNHRHAMSYNFQIYSQQALNLLSQTLPYLRTYKQKRGKLVLKNYNRLTPRNGKYSKEIFAKRKKFVDSFFDIISPKGRMIKIIQ